MEITRLTEKIRKEAEEERDRLRKEYEKKIEELKEEIEKEKEALRREEREKLKNEMEKIKRKELADKRISAQNELLAYRWEMIREILQAVKGEFRQRIGDYQKILREIIGKFAQPGDTIILAPEDLPLFPNEFSGIAKENSKEITAGVIIKKEREEIDFSLEKTLEAIKEEILLAFKKYLLTD